MQLSKVDYASVRQNLYLFALSGLVLCHIVTNCIALKLVSKFLHETSGDHIVL